VLTNASVLMMTSFRWLMNTNALGVIYAYWFALLQMLFRWFGWMMEAIRNLGKNEWVNQFNKM
jgi:hypothetical protein